MSSKRSGPIVDNHLALMTFEMTPPAEQARFMFRCWGVAKDDLDARAVLSQLSLTWERWTIDQRTLLWLAVNAIVRAERAKGKWQPKTVKNEYHRAAQLSRDAALLARGLRETLIQQSDVEHPALRSLVSNLEELARSGLWATANLDHEMAVGHARETLRGLRRRTPKNSGRISWVLLRDLVWLSSRKHHYVDEKTIRRYLSRRSTTPPPVSHFWRRNFPIMRSVARVPGPDTTGFAFDKPFRDYLSSNPRKKRLDK